jgi:cobalamin biosynthesis Mg chelatase CobN
VLNPSPPPKGVITLTPNCEVESICSASEGKYSIILHGTAKRDFRFTLTSEQEMNDWVAALKSQIEALAKHSASSAHPQANSRAPQSKRVNKGTHVFGEPLTEVMNRQRASGMDLKVPQVVDAALKYLDNQAVLCIEGLFRLSGSASRIQDLKNTVDAGHPVNLAGVTDVHEVAGLLKLYLRELPDPICTFALYPKFLHVQTEMNENYATAVKGVIQALPADHKNLLECLLKLITKVSTFSEKNKMTPTNLSIVFAPNIFRGETETPMSAIEDSQLVNDLLKYMIQQAHTLFEA